MTIERSFIEALLYVKHNEEIWHLMAQRCYTDWITSVAPEYSDFNKWAYEKYGIRVRQINPDINFWEYIVVDEKKYSFFQLKYSSDARNPS